MDWTGDRNSIFKILGASSHSRRRRERNDYYATDPIAVEWLLKLEDFSDDILEPACGEGHLSKRMIELGKNVVSSDIIDRGYGEVKNFFDYDSWHGDIITNPPYKFAQEFVEHAIKIIPEGRKVAMFLKIQFLEGKRRKEFFMKNPPIRVWVSSSRIRCALNGDFNTTKNGSAVCYAWFVWQKGYKGDTILKWFN